MSESSDECPDCGESDDYCDCRGFNTWLAQWQHQQEALGLDNLGRALAAAGILARAEISFMRGAPLTGLELQVRASRLVWP